MEMYLITPFNIIYNNEEPGYYVSIVKLEMNPIYSMSDLQKLIDDVVRPFYHEFVQKNPVWA